MPDTHEQCQPMVFPQAIPALMNDTMHEYPDTEELLRQELASCRVISLPCDWNPQAAASGKGSATMIDEDMRKAAIAAFAKYHKIKQRDVSLEMLTLSFLTNQLYLHVWSSVFVCVVGLIACTCLW